MNGLAGYNSALQQAICATTMNEQLTFNELQAYRTNQLSGPARYRVERLLLENPFYADALAGLEAMQQTATARMIPSDQPTTEQLADLRDALHQRIHESATKKRLWPLWIATTTAAILLMLAIAIYLIYFAPKQSAKPRSKPTHSVTSVRSKQAKNRLLAWAIASSADQNKKYISGTLAQSRATARLSRISNRGTALSQSPNPTPKCLFS